jgi:A/G-specific adenine glycosylase
MEINKRQKQYFTKQLMEWHTMENQRSLPWKEEKDPYKIWLSEIILQQTRAEQGLPYYLRFIEAYPRIEKLAKAKDEEVFRHWQGLGYYNRCKNMLATARYITKELKGKFPCTYDDIKELKGVGSYTAAAISSFAYNLPHAVVDGNVYRVLSRYFGIETAIDTTAGKKSFEALAGELLDKNSSATYNQAIMDIGATVCTPRSPDCGKCPLLIKCLGKKQNLIEYLPVKSKKLTVRNRYFHYILFTVNDKIWIRKRTSKDIWENLYEPFLVEYHKKSGTKQLLSHPDYMKLRLNENKPQYVATYTQRLTHQNIETQFFVLRLEKTSQVSLQGGKWIQKNDIKNFGFPKMVISFLEKNYLLLKSQA